ncbi:DNA polymerase domain-containing protein [Candidatus Bathyarchaeota archaeon]|nr:DNA polymerase domain-containing protein [Candidatus Bathyarchaeota archaeon]
MVIKVEKLTKVEFSNLEKILFPKLKITKAQVIEYYIKVAPKMLSFLTNRPLVVTRFPDGVNQNGFYEKDAPQGKPSWVETVKIHSETAKRDINYVLCNDIDTLIWLANNAAVEIHTPFSKADFREKPDMAFFDIDPEPPARYKDAIEVALLVKEKLDDLGLKSCVKTSGKKGFHIIVPIVRKYTFQETRKFVHHIGEQIAKEQDFVVSEFSETKKPGKVFVDYVQNSHGRTMVSPYSLRAVPDATVSTPLEWSEIRKGIKPTEFNILSVVKRKKDPWQRIFNIKQKLTV